MTVCISAIADRHKAIVSCVDTRVSTSIASFDPLVGCKIGGFRGWTVLSSGTMCYVEALVDSVYAELGAAPDNDPPSVERGLECALRSELPKFIAAKYLTPYGLDMPTFMNSRPEGFTDERWNELSRLMLEYSETYDAEIIVSGWGQNQEISNSPEATIFSVGRDGVTRHGDEGFYACGSGAPAALSTLYFFSQQAHMTLPETVYHVAAAKFMSERAEGVGPRTLLRVATQKGTEGKLWSGYFLQPEEMSQLYDLWSKYTPPRIPAEAEDKIVGILEKRGKLSVTEGHFSRRVRDSIKKGKHLDAQKSESEQ